MTGQVDDLVAGRPGSGTYGLALTETPPSQPGYFRVGNYVLYKKSTWSPVENGGRWDIGTMPEGGSRYGTYQVLRHRTSGATMLFVTTHLYTPGGLAGDRLAPAADRELGPAGPGAGGPAGRTADRLCR